MAKKHKAKSRRRNPFGGGHKRKGGRRRSNPGIFRGATSILKDGFWALVGLVLVRQAPQMVLGARNTGIFGYLANVVATVLAAMVGGKFLGPDAGRAMALGGGLFTVNRVIQDQFTDVGRVLSLSGVGDYTAFGDIRPGYYPLPVPTDAAGRAIIPAQLQPPAAPAANGRGMAGINRSSRFATRF